MLWVFFFFKQFAAAITYELEWTFDEGEESNLKWQKSICKEAKDIDPLIYHSPVCSKPFTNTTAPLSTSSGGQGAASSSGTYKDSSIRTPGVLMGLYTVVQCPNSQESWVYNAVSCIKAFYLHSVLVNHW